MSEEVFDFEKVLRDDAKKEQEKLPDERVADYFKREHPDWPPMQVQFYFAQHLNDRDLQDIGTQIEDADIYFAENARGDAFAKSLQNIAQRDKDHAIQTDNALVNAVHGTNVIVGHMDLLPEDPIQSTEYHQLVDAPYIEKDFDATLQNLVKKTQSVLHFQDVREEIMVNRFRDEMERIMDAYPDLKKKEQLKIFTTIGALHTTLFHKFTSEGLDTQRHFSHSPYTYDYTIQLMRSIAYGNKPDKELISRAYFTNLLTTAMDETMQEEPDDPMDFVQYSRAVAEKFSPDEVAQLHTIMLSDPPAETMNTILQKKGIGSLPTTNAEMQLYNQQNHKSKQKHTTRPMRKYNS